eukprot:1142503-Pelagomonas_calceolata.AAC.1
MENVFSSSVWGRLTSAASLLSAILHLILTLEFNINLGELQSLPPHFTFTTLCLHFGRTQFEPQQLASLASHFPNVLKLKTKSCELPASSAMEIVQCFPRLQCRRMSHASLPCQKFEDALAEAQRHCDMFTLKAQFEGWGGDIYGF